MYLFRGMSSAAPGVHSRHVTAQNTVRFPWQVICRNDTSGAAQHRAALSSLVLPFTPPPPSTSSKCAIFRCFGLGPAASVRGPHAGAQPSTDASTPAPLPPRCPHGFLASHAYHCPPPAGTAAAVRRPDPGAQARCHCAPEAAPLRPVWRGATVSMAREALRCTAWRIQLGLHDCA